MNLKIQTYLGLILLACAFVLVGCKKDAQKLPGFNPASSAFVNAFTTGEISKNSSIRVHFTEAVADSSEVGQEAPSSLFVFKPGISGTARWEDAHTLAFKPAQPLPSNQVFTADLKLAELFPQNTQAKAGFAFHFKTKAQSFEVEWTGNESGASGSSKWHNVRGRLVANDQEDPAEIVKLVEASYQGKAREIEWQPATANGVYAFVVKNLERGAKENDLVLRIKGASVGAENLTETVSIPSEGDFILNRVLSVNGSDQYITLEFSDPVDPKQRLEGMISLDGNNFTSSIDGNRIVVYPRKRLVGDLKVTANAGIRASNGKRTGKAVSKTVTMDSPKPQVALVKEGSIMPRTDKVPFLFKSVGLNKVDVWVIKVFEKNLPQFLQVNRLDGDREMVRVGRIVAEKTLDLDKKLNLRSWNTHSIDLSDIVSPEPGALYQVAVGFRKSYYVDRCTDAEENVPEYARRNMPESMLDLPGNWDNGYGMPESSFWDYYYYYGSWDDREDPCKQAYYRSSRAVRQNILSSDLGLMVKRGDMGEALVVVTDLRTTQPVNGAQIKMLNYQQQLIAEGGSNADGLWKIDLPNKPFLLTVQQGDQVGYLRLDDGNSLSYSRFDVGGKTLKKGLKGYIYGERGVWRPGDPMYLTFLLQDKEKSLPDNHPVTFILKNRQGQEVDRKLLTGGLDGFYAFESGTDADAPTGSYMASIEVGGATFTKALKVETIMPNRLKIAIDVGEDGLTESEIQQEVNLTATWLHGAKAGNLKAKVQAALRPRPTNFTAWKGYAFDDPGKNFSPDEVTFFDGSLDADGKASFPVTLSTNNEAPGSMNANFVTRVFERGGAASIDRYTTVFHPYNYYAGLKIPKGDASRGMLLTDTDHEMEMVAVNTKGEPVSGRELEIEFFKINWRWWWDRGSDNLAAYLSRQNNKPMQTARVTTDAKGVASWNLNVKYPEWGRYYLRVTDAEGHSTGKIMYIDWPGWAGRAQGENPGGASMLVFNADKEKYTVGEMVNLTIPSPNGGRALVSLESGNRILASYWVDCEEGGTKFPFEATSEMAPNIYASITLLQPHAQTVNDLPLRLYGAIPIAVEDPATVLEPTITMAEELRPNAIAKVAVAEKGGGPMTYTLAVVDEGLLGITRFKTPNPHGAFYQREALNIKTWDLFDQVIGAYGGKINSMLSIGGDGTGADPDKAKQNRFRPVVELLGPFSLKKGKTNQHEIEIPNYVGAVRVMIVAGRADGAYGKAEKEVPVRAPIMLAATLPRVIGPGETARLPVSVFAMKDNIKSVTLDLQTSGLIGAGDSKKQTISFPETGEKMAWFEVKAAQDIGSGAIKVKPSGVGESAVYETDIQVRIANPEEHEVIDKAITDGQTWNTSYSPLGMKGTNAATLEISSIPPLNLEKRLRYLIRYPYGCVEQTTSGAFPQLYLANLIELSPRQVQRSADNVRIAIDRLQKFQHNNGGLAYWPGASGVSDYSTTYAGHFLLEAKRKGFDVPDNFLKDWRSYQRKAARDWRIENREGWRQRTQAYRLFVLALDGHAEMGAMNRMRRLDNLNNASRWLLAGAYALAGQNQTADKLLKNSSTIVEAYREFGYSYGSHRRDKAMMLYIASLVRGKNEAGAELMKTVADNLGSSRWLSTQETGVSLMAIANYLGERKPGEGIEYEYKFGDGQWQKVKGDMRISQHKLPPDAATSIAVRANKDKVVFARLIKEGTPLEGTEEAASSKISLSVVYVDENSQPIPDISNLRQGQDFTAKVT